MCGVCVCMCVCVCVCVDGWVHEYMGEQVCLCRVHGSWCVVCV